MSCHVMPSTDHYRKIAEISMTILPNVQGVEALRSRAGLPDTWKWRRDVRSVVYIHVSLCVVCMCEHVQICIHVHCPTHSQLIISTTRNTLHHTAQHTAQRYTPNHCLSPRTALPSLPSTALHRIPIHHSHHH